MTNLEISLMILSALLALGCGALYWMLEHTCQRLRDEREAAMRTQRALDRVTQHRDLLLETHVELSIDIASP